MRHDLPAVPEHLYLLRFLRPPLPAGEEGWVRPYFPPFTITGAFTFTPGTIPFASSTVTA